MCSRHYNKVLPKNSPRIPCSCLTGHMYRSKYTWSRGRIMARISGWERGENKNFPVHTQCNKFSCFLLLVFGRWRKWKTCRNQPKCEWEMRWKGCEGTKCVIMYRAVTYLRIHFLLPLRENSFSKKTLSYHVLFNIKIVSFK